MTLRPADDPRDAGALGAFYTDIFPGRRVLRDWRWLYRREERPSFPLLVADGDRVLAHAGGIPFTARVGDREYRAAWFVDFVVRPECQRQGLGVRLTEAWMQQSELCVTFCNELSMSVFKRFGWIGSSPFAVHTTWVRPFDHPRARRQVPDALRAVGGRLASPALSAFFRSRGATDPHLEPVDSKAVDAWFQSPGESSDAVTPVRDAAYWLWRIDTSPDRAHYRLYRSGDVAMLVTIEGAARRSVDVLWASPSAAAAPEVVRRMLASLAWWAMRNGRSCLRTMPTSPAFEDASRALRPAVARPRFACWTRDPRLLEQLRSAQWRWQLLDSDFEWI